MSRTYKATGINLRGRPLGESDRLLTILTREVGLIQAVAPGARKHQSSLRGRAELFVVNQLLLSQGRSLDKIIQAETVESYSGLSQDLGKLAAGQYLAEVVLSQGLVGSQEDLFLLLSEHLNRLEQIPGTPSPQTTLQIIAYLTHGLFHLLALGGIAPQVQYCCRTRHPLIPPVNDPNWRAAFSIDAGGIFLPASVAMPTKPPPSGTHDLVTVSGSSRLLITINSAELTILQQLSQPQLPEMSHPMTSDYWLNRQEWISVERILRKYAEYHLDCSIRSATLIDSYLTAQSF